jgi:hypothetical protein
MRVYVIIGLLASCLSLSGCYEPFQNPGDWSATGATREDTAQQIANPSDLIQGNDSVRTTNGVIAAAAVDKSIGGPAGTGAGIETSAPAPVSTSGSGS